MHTHTHASALTIRADVFKAHAELCGENELIIYINVLNEIVVKRIFNLHILNIYPHPYSKWAFCSAS